MSLPKRTIYEVILAHRLNPDRLQEVYVEGISDKFIVEDVLRSVGLNHVLVAEISTIEIPVQSLEYLGFTPGNRACVITLASLLENKISKSAIVCIADADTDHVAVNRHSFSLLLYTDASSLEAYALHAEVINRFLQRSARSFPKNAHQIVEEIGALMIEGYLLRTACECLGFPASFRHDYTESLTFERRTDTCSIRVDHYKERMFRDLPHIAWQGLLNETVDKLRSTVPADPRKAIHGHDLESVFGWYIRSHSGFGHLNQETLRMMFPQLLDSAYLAKQPLFMEIEMRLKATSTQLTLQIP